MAKSKALVKKEASGGLSKLSEAGQKAVASHAMTADNIIIPRILLMQAMSEKVTQGEAKFGELRDTLENKMHGNEANPLEVIPFHSFETIAVQEVTSAGRRFVANLPARGNEGKAYEETVDGKNLINMYTCNIYCLLPQEIAEGMDLPYLLTFRSTSVRCGKKINTIMYMRNLAAGRDPWAAVIKLSVTKTQNDKGTFGVFDVARQRASTPEEMARCAHWFNVVHAGKTEIAEEKEAEPAPVSDGRY